MGIKITSQVRSARTLKARRTFFVTSTAIDPDADFGLRYVLGTFGYAESFEAALALAQSQRFDLETELMDAVHEYRASRREKARHAAHAQ